MNWAVVLFISFFLVPMVMKINGSVWVWGVFVGLVGGCGGEPCVIFN